MLATWCVLHRSEVRDEFGFGERSPGISYGYQMSPRRFSYSSFLCSLELQQPAAVVAQHQAPVGQRDDDLLSRLGLSGVGIGSRGVEDAVLDAHAGLDR